MNTKRHVRYRFSKSLVVFMFTGFILAGVLTAPAYAQAPTTLSGGYSFGPGTTRATSDARTLNVPARTTVSVVVLLQRNLLNSSGRPVFNDVDIVIDVFQPNGSSVASVPATATVVNAGLQIPSVSVPGIFSSQRGCPSTWRVRVHTVNDLAPPVRVFGTIMFAFLVPGTVNLDMEGDPVSVSGGQTKTVTLAGHNLTGAADRSLVAGTGGFRIMAKWHTDPLDIIHFNQFFQSTVALLKPDGTVAASQQGFSQHAPDPFSPRVDFRYTATNQDALMTGTWKVRITSAGTNPKIVNFDVERGLDVLSPSFNSTFSARCTSAVAVM